MQRERQPQSKLLLGFKGGSWPIAPKHGCRPHRDSVVERWLRFFCSGFIARCLLLIRIAELATLFVWRSCVEAS